MSIATQSYDLESNNRFFGRDITNMQIPKTQIPPKNLRYNSMQRVNNSQNVQITNKPLQKQNNPRGSSFDINSSNSSQNKQKYSLNNIVLGTSKCEQELNRIAKEDTHNPSLVSFYQTPIFKYLRHHQKDIQNPEYMKSQEKINGEMRSILIAWLVQVHIKFKLLDETLFLCVNLIDRFLAKQQISKEKLQLVGITALFTASKIEEIYPPHIKDFVEVTDRTYTKSEIFQMEGLMCKALNFELCIPSSLVFLNRYARLENSMCKYQSKEYYLARYLLELSMIDEKFLKYSQANLASSTIYLANKVFKKQECWSELLSFHAEYSEKDLRVCAKDLCLFLQSVSKNQHTDSLRKKFKSQKYMEISTIQLESIAKMENTNSQ